MISRSASRGVQYIHIVIQVINIRVVPICKNVAMKILIIREASLNAGTLGECGMQAKRQRETEKKIFRKWPDQ